MVLIHRDPPIYLLSEEIRFPDPSKAGEDGLVALSADLSPDRIRAAYARGIFPWFRHQGYTYWYSPDPRMILYPERLHISSSLGRRIRSGRFSVCVDRDFLGVMRACAEVPRRGAEGSWIDEVFMSAYGALFEAGEAHSVEVYEGDLLVGGLYGVVSGRFFCGESMFAKRPDASKVALAALCGEWMGRWGLEIIDCQVPSDHLGRMGGQTISRAEFLRLLHA
ncbi:MAG: leucyl/phenylalanyl-tRNA--protein transferase [Campylobacterales bacterium]